MALVFLFLFIFYFGIICPWHYDMAGFYIRLLFLCTTFNSVGQGLPCLHNELALKDLVLVLFW